MITQVVVIATSCVDISSSPVGGPPDGAAAIAKTLLSAHGKSKSFASRMSDGIVSYRSVGTNTWAWVWILHI
jgi:hypothetical protein